MICNIDESPFPTSDAFDKVYAERGMKKVESFATGFNCEQITTLFGGSASGRALHPLVLHDGVMHLATRFDETRNQMLVAVNRSGIIDNTTLVGYFKKEILLSLCCGKVLTASILRSIDRLIDYS